MSESFEAVPFEPVPTEGGGEDPRELKERAFHEESMRQVVKAAPEGASKQEYLAGILGKASVTFRGAEEEYGKFLQNIKNRSFENDEQLISQTAAELQTLRQRHFSLEEYQSRLWANIMDSRKNHTTQTKNNKLI
jgi:hypothetical protein